MKNIKNDFYSKIIVTGITESITVIIRLVLSIILARKLGVQGRGEYALALLIPGFFLIFTSLGIGEATAALIGKEKYPKEKIVGSLNFFILCVSVLSFFIYYGFSSLILKAVKNNISVQLYSISFFILPVTLMWGGYAAVLLGLSSVKSVGWGRLLNNGIFLLLIIITSLIIKLSALVAIAMFLFTSLIEVIFLMFYVLKFTKIKILFDWEILKEQLKFGTKFFLGGLFGQANRRLDSFLVNFFIGTYGLGIYTVAVSLAETLLNISNIFSRVIFSSSAVSKDNENIPITNNAIRQNLFFMTIFAIILGFILKPMILFLYSTEFVPAIMPAIILLPGIIALGLSGVVGYGLTGYGKPEEITKAAGVACVFTVILDLILIPKYGVNGASFASTIAYGISAIYLIFSYSKFAKQSLREILLIQKQDIKNYFVWHR